MKQMLRYPHLLRKQYLGRSPLWSSFINSNQVPPQVLKINMKLYSASILFNSIQNRVQNKLLIQQCKQYQKQLQGQFKQNYSNSDKCLEKVMFFLQVRESRHKSMENYTSGIYRMYKQLYPQRFSQQTKQIQNPTLANLLTSLYCLSEKSQTDQIDALILSTAVDDCQQFDMLVHNICQFNIESSMILTLIKQLMINLMGGGKFYDVGLFRKIFYRIKNYQTQSNMITNVLSTLDSLLSIGSKAKDVEVQTISRLMKGDEQKAYIYVDNKGKEKEDGQQYLHILLYQYLIYLDWLSVKCLYRQKSQPFIELLSQFMRKINFFSFNQIQKTVKNGSSSNDKIANIFEQLLLREQFCKLEILTYLYNQLLQVNTVRSAEKDNLSVNWAKFKQFSNEDVGIDKIIQLRKIKMKREKTLSNRFLNKSKKSNAKQDEIRQAMRVIKAIDAVIGVINNSPLDETKQNNFNIQIQNEIILKIAVKSLNSLEGVNPIIFDGSEIKSIWKVMREVKKTKKQVGTFQKSIQDWYRKLQKNFPIRRQGKLDFEEILSKQKICKSIEGKMVWSLMANPKLIQKQELKREVEQLRQQLFLISSNLKDRISKKKIDEIQDFDENSKKSIKNVYLLSVYDFFQ